MQVFNTDALLNGHNLIITGERKVKDSVIREFIRRHDPQQNGALIVLDYDGRYSASALTVTAKSLEGAENVTESKAKAIAADFLGVAQSELELSAISEVPSITTSRRGS